MRSLLWIGDACVSTGFARATHYTLDMLRMTWGVHVLGINYDGDPHSYPYPIYPCMGRHGRDLFGLSRMVELINKIKPSVVVVQNDPWNLPDYMRKAGNIPVVASLAVDGKNCMGRGLNGLALAIFWTRFGEQEARLGGYAGPSAVVSLGVDLNIYHPQDQLEARRMLGMRGAPQFDTDEKLRDAFIVGNVNRNQQRKRLDLTISYFAEWIQSRRIDNAYLFLHIAPTGEKGCDAAQLAYYYGIANRLIVSEPEIGQGVPERYLAATYAAFSAQLTTTQGEGMGLTTLEGMACGVPQIIPDWAALGELPDGVVIKIPCTSIACTPNGINVIGGVPDREATIEALDLLYRNKGKAKTHNDTPTEPRAELSKRGLEFVSRPCYRWPAVGEAFGAAMNDALYPSVVKQETVNA